MTVLDSATLVTFILNAETWGWTNILSKDLIRTAMLLVRLDGRHLTKCGQRLCLSLELRDCTAISTSQEALEGSVCYRCAKILR